MLNCQSVIEFYCLKLLPFEIMMQTRYIVKYPIKLHYKHPRKVVYVLLTVWSSSACICGSLRK